ncbi:hypothetical protein RAS1_31340 [Phycisphaerae bacterium RAS1]|nr:hypothetical protein RAS1_31340 [Phycisphaerae bacterium RAS1]
MSALRYTSAAIALFSVAASVSAERYFLLTGADARLYPGTARNVAPVPGPGFPGQFSDGDRLAGTADRGATVNYLGNPPQPLIQPNAYGSLSMLYRRGSIPAGGPNLVPLEGIEFLGGPLLDLDGDAANGVRSLVPVSGQTPILIGGSDSYVELTFNLDALAAALLDFDATGTNEGAPGFGPALATIIVNLSGTGTQNEPPAAAINPTADTRVGTLAPHAGVGGALSGVYRIQDLGYELWEDTILDSPSTGPFLGTLQYMGAWRGWMIERGAGGSFPVLSGQGLGSTLWPLINTSQVGNTFNTAYPIAGTTATIATGINGDQYTAAGNGGLALADFGGDLGAYIDNVVVPLTPGSADRIVYLEAGGWGINNSFDPLFADTICYDSVIIAAGDSCEGYVRCDANCDGAVNILDINPLVLAISDAAAYQAMFPACSLRCNTDINGDGATNVLDINPFVDCILLP